jgi:voltage-dependent calcium channel beta-2
MQSFLTLHFLTLFYPCRPVAFSVKTNVMYDGTLDDETPVHGSAVSFRIGDYLHIFEKFDANWWVGRKVKENCDIGFVPSPDRLEQLILQKAPVGKLDRVKTGAGAGPAQPAAGGHPAAENGQAGDDTGAGGVRVTAPPVIEKKKGFLGKKCETLSPYDVVPIMRPVVMVGPSLKGYEVTDMLQKAVFEFLKNRFEGRIIITHVAADLSLGKTSVLNNPSNRKAER